MIPVKSRSDVPSMVKVIEDPVRVILEPCCKHYQLIIGVKLAQEFEGMRPWAISSNFLQRISLNKRSYWVKVN